VPQDSDVITLCIFCKLSLDATNYSSFGKMVNDSPDEYANSNMRREVVGKIIHLCLFAKHDITKGTELRYILYKLSFIFPCVLP